MRRALFDRMPQKAWEHVVEAAESDGLDDPRTHISWAAADLDRRGFDEAVDLLAETVERYLAIQAEAAGRLNALPPEERETEKWRAGKGTDGSSEERAKAGRRGAGTERKFVSDRRVESRRNGA